MHAMCLNTGACVYVSPLAESCLMSLAVMNNYYDIAFVRSKVFDLYLYNLCFRNP